MSSRNQDDLSAEAAALGTEEAEQVQFEEVRTRDLIRASHGYTGPERRSSRFSHAALESAVHGAEQDFRQARAARKVGEALAGLERREQPFRMD